MGEVILHPAVRKQLEAVVERKDNVINFEANVRDLAALAQGPQWSVYQGEDVSPIMFGGGFFNCAPTACAICHSVMGAEDRTETGYWFWSKFNGDGRAMCADCHRRWWNENGEPA